MVLFEVATGPDQSARFTLPILVMLVVAVFTAFIMNRTSLGRQLYAMGGNPEAARRVGVSLSTMQWFAYGYLGLLAGVAGREPVGRVVVDEHVVAPAPHQLDALPVEAEVEVVAVAVEDRRGGVIAVRVDVVDLATRELDDALVHHGRQWDLGVEEGCRRRGRSGGGRRGADEEKR